MELYRELSRIARGCRSLDALAESLRAWKQRHFLRIGGREWLGLAGFEETTAQLSDLAEVALQVGLEALGRNPGWWRATRAQEPVRRELPSGLVVMGYGKLGGSELNYVSDIDLAFFSGPSGSSGEERQDVERFCTGLTRLIRDQVGGDKVFQVDLRLRPGGKDAPLATSCEAAVEHYQIHGQAWERQALLKARPVAGERSLGRAFIQEVRPFVFRRFLDFQALDELRRMRDKILAETGRALDPSAYDVKLGLGGIREIEFIVQSFQLVYGGRFRDLDEPNTLRCLEALGRRSLLPAAVVGRLRVAYVFLRQVEHWLQLDANRARRKLPADQEKRSRLARCMGFEGPETFVDRLAALSGSVHEHFESLFREARVQAEGAAPASREAEGGAEDLAGPEGALPADLAAALEGFHGPVARIAGRVMQRLSGSARVAASRRVSGFLQQAQRRPGLRRMLEGEPSWLETLLDGLARSDLVAALLGHQPSLVEGLQSPRGRSAGQPWAERQEASIIQDCRDFEEALEWIRRLKNERILALALDDLKHDLPYSRITSSLSQVADFVLRETLEAVDALAEGAGQGRLAVLGLGKLGSRQMGWLSDLDLMFVYDPQQGPDRSEGIPERMMKRIQRFMRMLSTPLQDGPGYPVDTALRPTGNYGPLAVTATRWKEYYASEADIWEIQSLLRMRAVAGNGPLGASLEAQARVFCFAKRPVEAVWPRLCHLRGRMERERTQEGEGRLNLKLGAGGAADLEFLVQGVQLLDGAGSPDLQGGNILSLLPAALERLGLGGPEIDSMAEALEALYRLELRLQLYSNQSGGRITREQLEGMAACGLWPLSGADRSLESWEDLVQLRRRVRALWEAVCRGAK